MAFLVRITYPDGRVSYLTSRSLEPYPPARLEEAHHYDTVGRAHAAVKSLYLLPAYRALSLDVVDEEGREIVPPYVETPSQRAPEPTNEA